MIRAKWVVGTLLTLGLIAIATAQDGRLQAVRDDVRSPSNSNSDNSSESSDSPSNPSCDDTGSGDVFGSVVMLAVLAPFIGPIRALDDEYHFQYDFARHPYANSYRGYQVPPMPGQDLFDSKHADGLPTKPWAVRLSLENGNDFRGLNRLGGHFRLDTASRFGVVTNWNWYQERLSCGCTDELVIGDVNVIFRFAQNEYASMYAGVGFRMLVDRQQEDYGFNFTYGGDWFPMRPFIVSGVFDAGSLGNTGVIHARGTVGAIYRGWEIFAGFDFMQIGSANLHGPMAGVRLWF